MATDTVFQHFFAFLAEGAEFSDRLGRHLHVRESFSFAGVAHGLAFTRAQYAFADHGRFLGGSVAAQFLVFHRGYFNVNVDAVD